MLVDQNNKKIDNSAIALNLPSEISEEQVENIREFFRGNIRAHHNSENKDKPFTVRDFIGNDNRDWDGISPIALYNAYSKTYDQDEAYHQSAMAAGRIFKQVLINDSRLYKDLGSDGKRHSYAEIAHVDDADPTK